MEVSPHDPNVVYYGSQYLHKTDDGGRTWKTISEDLTAFDPKYRMRSGGPIDEDISGEEYYAVLYAIQESPLQKGVIWTGSNDGLFHLTRDGGTSWKNVTPEMPEGGRVSNIEASPHDPAKAYFAIYRDYLGDETPYLYRTEDFGETWKLISRTDNGFPEDHPIRVVREDTEREGLLFAGTEFGLFVSFDDGARWHPFQQNLPVVPVTDMQIHRNDLVLSTLGRSFWVMDAISPLRQLRVDKQSFTLFQPEEIIEPNLGIYFQLPETVTDSSVSIEFKRGDELIHSKVESLKKLPADRWGVRRSEWDLRYYLKYGENSFKGPRIAPGTYQVSVSYDGKTLTEKLSVRINPELEKSGVSVSDLVVQQNISLEVARLYMEIDQFIKYLEQAMEKTKSRKKKEEQLQRLNQLKKGPRRYDKPMLIDHVDYLYDMVSEAQQPIGAEAMARYTTLKKRWEDLKQELAK